MPRKTMLVADDVALDPRALDPRALDPRARAAPAARSHYRSAGPCASRSRRGMPRTLCCVSSSSAAYGISLVPPFQGSLPVILPEAFEVVLVALIPLGSPRTEVIEGAS